MVNSLEAQLEDVDRKKGEILGKIDERNSRKKIGCAVDSCGKSHQIKGLILIQTSYRTGTYGCTGGGDVREGEMQFICPDTKIVNRIMISNYDVPSQDRDMYDHDPEAQFERNYKSLFKEVIGYFGSYSRGSEELDNEEVEELIDVNARNVNNYYVDQNRKKFGLVEVRKEKEF